MNNRFVMGGTGRGFLERRLGLMPLLLHPAPKTALFLGVGAGTTVGEAGRYPRLRVVAAELLPEVVELLPEFWASHHLDAKPNVIIHAADARRFVRASEEHYDVIVADLFHPARDGAGLLYTPEHYGAVRARLADGGLFAQWLPLYQMSLQTMRTIVRSFVAEFPESSAYLAHFNVDSPVVGLVGSERPILHSPEWYRDTLRQTDAALLESLEQLALVREVDLFGCVVADDTALRAFAAGAPLNGDLHPVLTFTAPRFLYDPDQPRYARLQQLLSMWTPSEHTVKAALRLDDASTEERVTRYARARDMFLRSQIARFEPKSPSEPLQLLLESVPVSSDFRTSYVTAIQIAVDLHGHDPEASRAILEKLLQLAPSDPLAESALRQLFRDGEGAAKR